MSSTRSPNADRAGAGSAAIAQGSPQVDAQSGAPARRVRCPGCGRPAEFSPANAWRPFCSQRCRGVDLGAWATERYRVAEQPPTDEEGGQPELP